jgi:hypothetical protein
VNPDVPGFPPGLVTYLAVSDDHLTSAFNRSLTSLAERGWLVITPEDNGASSARLVETAVRGQLPASEMLVLERVRTCSRSMPTVPLSELTNPDGDAYEKWRKRFKRALDEESRAAGLTTRRMPGALTVPFSLVTAAVTGAIGAVAASADRSGVAIGAGLAGFVAGLVASVFLTEHRPTELGKQAAAQARIEMRQASKERAALAQEPADAGTRSLAAPRDRAAAVTVPAPRSPAEALLEKDGRPLPEGKAWSAFTGRWRVVSVGPLEAPVQRGRPRALFTGIYYAAFGTLAASLYGLLAVKGLEGGALAAAPGALFVLYVLGRWLPAFTRRLSVVRRVVHRAQVVKRWMDHVSQPGSDTVSAEYYCSVDGGTTDETQSFRLAKNMYQRLNVGDIVEVDYSPRWRKLRRIRKLK